MNTPKPNPFYNRHNELLALERAYQQSGNGGHMILLYGRRRLGKTFLLQRFFTSGKDGSDHVKPHCFYIAEQTSSELQRRAMGEYLLQSIPSEGVNVEDISGSWNALFRFVSAYGRTLDGQSESFGLVLDEFSYLVERNPELPSVLQSWWDREGVHSKIFVVLCGSQLSAMASLGEESKPLYGRFNAGIHRLRPLSYNEAALFYKSSAYSLEEKLMWYGVLGGTPRYHAIVNFGNSFAEEIIDLFIRPMALLENEAHYLLGSEQIRDPSAYNAILRTIASGATQFNEIQQKAGLEGCPLTFYLKTLADLDWIIKEISFGDKSGRRAIYRINDPFLSFWYRFIAPLSSVLRFSDPEQIYRERVEPNLDDYMGRYAFENICKQWLQTFGYGMLGLNLRSIMRYWSRDGSLEIDIVGEIEGGTYLFGECKWSVRQQIGLDAYITLKTKIGRLPESKWRTSPACILFSVGGFTENLVQLASDPNEKLYLVDGQMLLKDNNK
jgi:AAA+ ATPase superfamily predicted ATPase